MRNGIFGLLLQILSLPLFAQTTGILTVDKIMRDPKWIGSSPSGITWNPDGSKLFFNWNPENAADDSLYFITPVSHTPVKANEAEKAELNNRGRYQYNRTRSAFVYNKRGDIYYTDLRTGKTLRITQTNDFENNPQFSFRDTRIVFQRDQNLYAWDITDGTTMQLTNMRSAESGSLGSPRSPRSGEGRNPQEDWLRKDQLQYFEILRSRKEKKEATDAYNRSRPREKELRTINLEDRSLQGLSVSPDGRFISYRLYKSPPASAARTTIVPSFVTETGFTTDIPSRTKVGAQQGQYESFIYDRERDTIFSLKTDAIPGIGDPPDYLKDYPVLADEKKKKTTTRMVQVRGISWSPEGTYAVADIHSIDNKDRWLMLLDTATGSWRSLDRQRDDAWIGGPGTGGFGSNNTGWIDEYTFWFCSETTGYSHLYTLDVRSGQKKALTAGNYEVQQVFLSLDHKYFYLTTNEVHPGEKHFYRLSVATGEKEQLTTMTGANQVSLSPDEKWMAILYSYSNKPWELYLQENLPPGKRKKVAQAVRITDKSQSDEFKAYPWRDPELIHIQARDGATIYARLYKPTNPHPEKPAVFFIHGAGYVQNAHKWWSSYFHEYMFNNLLADNGYYVMDIDYRGSAGYGRDWRTGIYRHMGGKDLSDHVDAVKFLVSKYGVNPDHIGLYGGSYGGFLTLMGLFTEPDVFAAGAALRPVTDWANYNHGYTSNILNEPFLDSIAYRRSSPLYFAEGLKGHLLICHGMMDLNVHYQDAVKLTQRLIELGKENWELASYPLEEHGFTEPSSWRDEYRRIYKLFETVLKRSR
ncbi:MAG: prolyl oligopeptidase family serine peptidase [Chitinophagaceae bacterium]